MSATIQIDIEKLNILSPRWTKWDHGKWCLNCFKDSTKKQVFKDSYFVKLLRLKDYYTWLHFPTKLLSPHGIAAPNFKALDLRIPKKPFS